MKPLVPANVERLLCTNENPCGIQISFAQYAQCSLICLSFAVKKSKIKLFVQTIASQWLTDGDVTGVELQKQWFYYDCSRWPRPPRNVRLAGSNWMDKLNGDHGWKRVLRRAENEYNPKGNEFLAGAAATADERREWVWSLLSLMSFRCRCQSNYSIVGHFIWVRGINGNDIDSFHSNAICWISSLMII